MGQIHGSGLGNWNNAAVVDSSLGTQQGRLYVDSKSVLFNSAGSEIKTHYDAEGDPHLGTVIIQDILTSTGNSTTDNIVAGGSYVGSAEGTLGVNGIQVYHYADQDCTINIDQSLDATNWDISDSFNCLANHACTRTFISVAPYFRGRVENISSSDTTDLRFSMGMTPIINPLPRALTTDERLKSESTLVGQQNTDRHVWVTPNNTLNTNENVRLVGTNFDGTTKNTNFWTEETTSGATITQSGKIILSTGSTANATSKYYTNDEARFVVGGALQFQCQAKFTTSGTVNNLRRIGPYDSQDGYYFQILGSDFAIGHRFAGSDTLISNGSFNGNIGPRLDPAYNTYYKGSIEWGSRGAFWYVNGQLLHKNTKGELVNKNSLPITIENNNINGGSAIVNFDMLAAATLRQGQYSTQPTCKYIGTNTTTVLKHGPGILHKISILDNTGTIGVYKAPASGTDLAIALIDASKGWGTLDFECPFSSGLSVVTGGNAKITVVYE